MAPARNARARTDCKPTPKPKVAGTFQKENEIRKDEREKVLKKLDTRLHNLTEEMANKYGKGLPERERGEIIGIIDARIEIKKLLKQRGGV